MLKRLNEIMSRKAEIRTAIQNADAEAIARLTTETNALLEEETQLRGKMDLNGRLGAPIATPEAETDREQRARDLREKRAITLQTSGMLKPMESAKTMNGQLGTPVASIIDMVDIIDCAGMSEYQVPYEKDYGAAGITDENTDATDGDPVFEYATIKPVSLTTYSEISREVMAQTNTNYYDKVIESARIALRKKAAAFILDGDGGGSPVFVGIKDAEAIDTATDVAVSAIDATTLRKIAMNYGGAENVLGNAVLFLNKADLIAFGDVRGTNEKKAVFEITPDSANPNVGIIKDGGLAVQYCLASNLTDTASAASDDYTMVYGVPKAYQMGVFSDFTVRVSGDYAFKRRMLAVLGEVQVGGNVVFANGFVRVKKG
jgi:HK97 family phage major capsid protein